MKNTSNSPNVKTNPVQGSPSRESRPVSCEAVKPGELALNIQEILVPTDFSDYSKKALIYGASIAKRVGAKITLLHVVEPPVTSYPYAGYPFNVELLIRETLCRVGLPYQEIANTAAALKSDLIVIATRGRTGFAHALLGSTTERVVRHAPCPVLVVRERERECVTVQS
ncbi:MAG: universal stress protein [Verrucomicrobiota bacterium]